jgi:organic radical activating enzyme
LSDHLIEYRKRVLDAKSPSFCGAKWYNATTWLGSGTTASCHHPTAHKIPLVELEADHTAIHNTKHKKAVRKMMQEGERPKECEYCWRIEDMGKDSVSDRVFKSEIYSEEDLQKAYEMDWKDSVDLKTFEIAFDRTCNLACSYCNPSFSSTWARDIKKLGPYQNLLSDGAGAFEQDGSWTEPYGRDEENPYITAFWKWWDSGLSDSLEELRITGGEPLMSGNTWKLFDWFEQQDSDMRFAVNTNFMAKDEIVDRLIEKSHHIKHFELYTSAECYGAQQEFLRDGFEWDTWSKNMDRFAEEGNYHSINIMMTITALSVFSITEFLDEVTDMKQRSRAGKHPVISVNILRFPSFQSVVTLPEHIRAFCRNELFLWIEENKNLPCWLDFEIASLQRLVDYLYSYDSPFEKASELEVRQQDLKSFFDQYCDRRGKDINVFPTIFTEWYNSLESGYKKAALKSGDNTRFLDDNRLIELRDIL